MARPAGRHAVVEVAAARGDVEAFAAINLKYELEMDFESVPGLCERFGLTLPEL